MTFTTHQQMTQAQAVDHILASELGSMLHKIPDGRLIAERAVHAVMEAQKTLLMHVENSRPILSEADMPVLLALSLTLAFEQFRMQTGNVLDQLR